MRATGGHLARPAVAGRGLVCQFGPVRAVDDLSFEVARLFDVPVASAAGGWRARWPRSAWRRPRDGWPRPIRVGWSAAWSSPRPWSASTRRTAGRLG
jgi:hypothetical protein